jgi:hypothetical protein
MGKVTSAAPELPSRTSLREKELENAYMARITSVRYGYVPHHAYREGSSVLTYNFNQREASTMTKYLTKTRDVCLLLLSLGGLLAFMVFALVAIAFAGRMAEMILAFINII